MTNHDVRLGLLGNQWVKVVQLNAFYSTYFLTLVRGKQDRDKTYPKSKENGIVTG